MAESVVEYAAPLVAPGREAVAIWSGVTVATSVVLVEPVFIWRMNSLVNVCLAPSVTVIENLKFPETVGVPLKAPVAELSEIPPGNLVLLLKRQVRDSVPPTAFKVAE